MSLESEIDELEKEYKELQKELEALDKELAEAEADVKKLPANPVVRLEGLVKAYMDAVKETDGLTSVRPATLKAVQTAEKVLPILP